MILKILYADQISISSIARKITMLLQFLQLIFYILELCFVLKLHFLSCDNSFDKDGLHKLFLSQMEGYLFGLVLLSKKMKNLLIGFTEN